MRFVVGLATLALMASATAVLSSAHAGELQVGTMITPDNTALVAEFVSPGNYILVKQGMRMKIAPSQHLEWPPPYQAATEKYSPQVQLGEKGDLLNYVAGLPFPAIKADDPQAAAKVMWNFSFRPQYTDDLDLRYLEVGNYAPAALPQSALEHFTIGHFGFYNYIGRTEVLPTPTDPEMAETGIRYRFGAFPFLEPQEIRGFGLIRYRSINPRREDNAWYFNPLTRHLLRVSTDSDAYPIGPISTAGDELADGLGANYANNLDPDSYFGFSARPEGFNFRLLGIKRMLAVAHAENSPAKPCPFDGNRTICPEAWEMRQVYIVEAIAKPQPWMQMIGRAEMTIPRRVLYVDSEGWFITASDLYDRSGRLWKTIATFNTYRDRPVPDARIAVYPFKRIFQTALVDEDVQTGYSSLVLMPGPRSPEHECWYINMGVVSKAMLEPDQMAGHVR
jgi:hypothetical protein